MNRTSGGAFWPIKQGDSLSSVANAAFGPFCDKRQLLLQTEHLLRLNRSIVRDAANIHPGQLLYISHLQTFPKSDALLSQDIWETNRVWQSLNVNQQNYLENNWPALEVLWESLIDPVGFLSGVSDAACIDKLHQYLAQMKPPPPDLILEVRLVISRRLLELIDLSQQQGEFLLRQTRLRVTNRVFIIFENTATLTKYYAKLTVLKQLGHALNWLGPKMLPAEVGLAVGTVIAQNTPAGRRQAVWSKGFELGGGLLGVNLALTRSAAICRASLSIIPATRLLAKTQFCEGFAITLATVIAAGAAGSTIGKTLGEEGHRFFNPND